MSAKIQRMRAEAFSGQGYGSLRYNLFKNAGHHIEKSIREGYFCEAIAVTESVITDRLESRLSYLQQKNVGFQNLGPAVKYLQSCETDATIIAILADLDRWREKRNTALHELVKIDAGKPKSEWVERIQLLSSTANEGYELLKKLYHSVADLNPHHVSRAFERSTG